MNQKEITAYIKKKTGVELSGSEATSVALIHANFLAPKLEWARTAMMEFQLFRKKYEQMRRAQKGYFKTKNTLLLEEVKKLEKECDQLIKKMAEFTPISLQQKLFE